MYTPFSLWVYDVTHLVSSVSHKLSRSLSPYRGHGENPFDFLTFHAEAGSTDCSLRRFFEMDESVAEDDYCFYLLFVPRLDPRFVAEILVIINSILKSSPPLLGEVPNLSRVQFHLESFKVEPLLRFLF